MAGLLSDGALHFVVMLTSDWGRSGTLLLLLIALVVASVTAHDVAVLGKEALKRRFERPRLVRERKHARTGRLHQIDWIRIDTRACVPILMNLHAPYRGRE